MKLLPPPTASLLLVEISRIPLLLPLSVSFKSSGDSTRSSLNENISLRSTGTCPTRNSSFPFTLLPLLSLLWKSSPFSILPALEFFNLTTNEPNPISSTTETRRNKSCKRKTSWPRSFNWLESHRWEKVTRSLWTLPS